MTHYEQSEALVDGFLWDVDPDKTVRESSLTDENLPGLVDCYNRFAAKDGELPLIKVNDTMATFKEYLDTVPPDELQLMFFKYVRVRGRFNSMRIVRSKEQFKHRLIGWGVALFGFVVVLITTALVFRHMHGDIYPRDTIFTEIMDMVLEIIRILTNF